MDRISGAWNLKDIRYLRSRYRKWSFEHLAKTKQRWQSTIVCSGTAAVMPFLLATMYSIELVPFIITLEETYRHDDANVRQHGFMDTDCSVILVSSSMNETMLDVIASYCNSISYLSDRERTCSFNVPSSLPSYTANVRKTMKPFFSGCTSIKVRGSFG